MGVIEDTKLELAKHNLKMIDIPVYCRCIKKKRYAVNAVGMLHTDGSVTVYTGSLIYDGVNNKIIDKDLQFKSLEQATNSVAQAAKTTWTLSWRVTYTNKRIGTYVKCKSPGLPYNEEEALKFWADPIKSTMDSMPNDIYTEIDDTKEDDEETTVNDSEEIYSYDDLKNEVITEDLDNIIRTFKNILENKGNALFIGASGIGKSYLAEKLVKYIIGHNESNRIYRIPIDDSYTSQDLFVSRTISGNYKKEDFLKFIELSNMNEDKEFFVIIEEISRFNFSSVMNPVFTIMERNKDLTEILPGGIKLRVKNNLHFICTTNEYDGSSVSSMIGNAVKSRFGIIRPQTLWGTEALLEYVRKISTDNLIVEEYLKLDNIVTKINKELNNNMVLRRGNIIGHRCLLSKKKLQSIQDIKDIINTEIVEQYESIINILDTGGELVEELRRLGNER